MSTIAASDGAVFERHEKKYRLSESLYAEFLSRLQERARVDRYGKQTIGALYFDTNDWLLARRSASQPKYKEKLRLRCYGAPTPDSTVYFEMKKKFDGISYKRRIPAKIADVATLLDGAEASGRSGQILDELKWTTRYYRLAPRIILFYERTAFWGTDERYLRVTFDENVRFRTDRLEIAPDAATDGTPLLDPGERIMEIKVPETLPLWLSRTLTELRIFPVHFSKYDAACRYINKEKTSHA
ncbi:MAG: polyphosphate polymerase domain-containing protein [Thermoguttaceae bacterium]|nr:polyphosphate polymerase domain-containing protein [Thermoguttaceae bacterium]